jgi:hypothetical protein
VMVCLSALPWMYCCDLLYLAGAEHHGSMCLASANCKVRNSASFKDKHMRIIF